MAESLRALVEAVRESRRKYDRCEACMDCADVRFHERMLATYLLTHPEAVEAVEVMRAWGEARAKVTAVRSPWRDGQQAYRERCDADDRAACAEMKVRALADRLAGGVS